MAVNENFRQNIYHRSLYDYYVHSVSVKKPHMPPYYTKGFFEEIKEAEERGYKVSKMKVKQWYNLLVEKYVTHEIIQGVPTLITKRLEFINPHIDQEI